MSATTTLLRIALACSLVAAAAVHARQLSDADRLIAEIGERNHLMRNLEELCDGIGPRMTGSPQLRTAQAWAIDKFKAYGGVNVREEPYAVGRPWRRGVTRARLLNANGQQLDVVQKAWTRGTGGRVRGKVALLDVKTLDEFERVAPTLRGKIVLIVSGPEASPEQRKDMKQYVASVNQVARDARFAAVLQVSGKDAHLNEMWGGPGSRFDRSAGIITGAHASLLTRLMNRGVVPEVELELGGGFAARPVKAYNVVAEIRGSELPEEVVIVGAHQDSWDLGTGATDNGAGTVVAIEVLRAMQAAGLKPKRTLRVVLFSGEEQGLLGSRAYVSRHRAALHAIQAVLVQDTGAGAIIGFPDMRVDAWYAGLQAALALAQRLGPIDLAYGVGRGSDHEVFFDQGIPAFAPMQKLRDYRTHTQHSEADTVDHVIKADLVHNAQVMAVAAWGLLNGPRLPQQALLGR